MSHDSEQIHTLRVLLHVTQYPQYSTISLDSDILHIFYSFSISAIPSTNPANARRLSPHTTNITYLSNVPLTRHQCLYVLLHLDLSHMFYCLPSPTCPTIPPCIMVYNNTLPYISTCPLFLHQPIFPITPFIFPYMVY